jgi:hypothetical protein
MIIYQTPQKQFGAPAKAPTVTGQRKKRSEKLRGCLVGKIFGETLL